MASIGKRRASKDLDPSIRTNAWQGGLLMFITPGRKETLKTFSDIVANFASELMPCSPYECLKGLEAAQTATSNEEEAARTV